MENKVLEQQFEIEIDSKIFTNDQEEQIIGIPEAAKGCSGITLEHMEKVLEWAGREGWKWETGHFNKDMDILNADEVVDLYFESLNKKP